MAMNGGYMVVLVFLAIAGAIYIWDEWKNLEDVADKVTERRVRKRVLVGLSVGMVTMLVITLVNYLIYGGGVDLLGGAISTVIGSILGGVLPTVFSKIYEEEL